MGKKDLAGAAVDNPNALYDSNAPHDGGTASGMNHDINPKFSGKNVGTGATPLVEDDGGAAPRKATTLDGPRNPENEEPATNYKPGESGGTPSAGGGGGGTTGTSQTGDVQPATPAEPETQADLSRVTPQMFNTVEAPAPFTDIDPSKFTQYNEAQPGDLDKLDHINTDEYQKMLDEWVDAARQQSESQIDYGVNKAVTELQRNEEDAQQGFQNQRNQIDADEAKALKNQGLYAEARGDRGGVGMAQYNSVQNNAAQARLSVNQAQQKLATDTARQIADLRAQGDFQKADAALQLTQNYLSQMMQLWQYATSSNMTIDQFNSQIDQFILQYNQQVQQLNNQQAWNLRADQLQVEQLNNANYWQTQDYNMQVQQLNNGIIQNQQSLAANAGSTLLAAGIMPDDEQLAAMGLSKQQAQSYLQALGLTGSGSGSGSGKGSSGKNVAGMDFDSKQALADWVDDLIESQIADNGRAGQEEYADAEAYAKSVLESKGYTDADWKALETFAETNVNKQPHTSAYTNVS